MTFYDRLTQRLLRGPVESTQYASGDYQRMLAQHGIVCSMSRRGDCWDNAVAESFFATLKVELVHNAAWATRAAAAVSPSRGGFNPWVTRPARRLRPMLCAVPLQEDPEEARRILAD